MVFDGMRCERPLTVDAIILYGDKIVFVRRGNEPYKGRLALPGGFVEKDETVEQAVVREAREETGLETEIVRLIGVYSDPGRDPRGQIVSVCYLMRAMGGNLSAASDASDAVLIGLTEIPALAFDHNLMIEEAKQYL